MKIAIVGGGIGGITMAIALKRANIPFVVYEATKKIKPVGAGIAIANNAMQVYNYLSIADKITAKGVRISKVALTNMKLEVLNTTDLLPYEKKYKLANIAIHRSELHKVLLGELDQGDVILDKRLKELSRDKEGNYVLLFEDGSKAIHQYVVGADGIRSTVRKAVFGQQPLRDAHQVCWRGILDFKLSKQYEHLAIEGWGKGKRLGFVKLDDQQVYWYFLVNENMYLKNNDLFSHLDDSAPIVKQMIKQTPSDTIHIDKIFDLKPTNYTWYKDRVCLIGDSAHATTPNLGQGACQAIEDVYIISQLLKEYTLEEAMQKFSAIRFKRVKGIVRNSWLLGQMAQFTNPILVVLRNMSFRLLPAFLKNKQLNAMFELDTIASINKQR
ncbi:FAD-dependent monooxygenase [Myroides injenensis]|uniref:FAD-dependent monooxygenase n=1 Tax=Myroides injenensis TaxID=1183151 RepID=UPI002270170D|nr:FAD-dependent monooxygenase [Myroides injenensis]